MNSGGQPATLTTDEHRELRKLQIGETVGGGILILFKVAKFAAPGPRFLNRALLFRRLIGVPVTNSFSPAVVDLLYFDPNCLSQRCVMVRGKSFVGGTRLFSKHEPCEIRCSEIEIVKRSTAGRITVRCICLGCQRGTGISAFDPLVTLRELSLNFCFARFFGSRG